MLNSKGRELQLQKGGKGGRFERVPGVGIGSSQVHVLFNIKVVGDGL